MFLILLFYLLGCILAAILDIKGTIRENEEVTVTDLFITIFSSFFSWITVIIFLVGYYGDVVLYKSKEKEE